MTCDASGFGEGEAFLGAVEASSDHGIVDFVAVFPQPIPAGRIVTATATDLTSADTSEFSPCVTAQTAAITGGVSVLPTEAGSSGAFAFSPTTFPAAPVTFALSSSDTTEGTVDQASLALPAHASAFRGGFIIGVDDGIDDGEVPYLLVTGTATSADPNYNGLNPPDGGLITLDNDDRNLQCNPTRPRVNVSVVKIGGGQLRATVTVGRNGSNQNELVAIAWTRFDTATVVLDGVGPVQVGQRTAFSVPLTQSASFTITRTPSAQSGTVRLTITDGCGDWPTFVGGGPRAW
jgi:hypothetical protein